MFTGLVEIVARVTSLERSAGGERLCLDLGALAADVKNGDSICVNGICLTASTINGSDVCFDVMPETLKVGTLSQLQSGATVNIERAMRADGRFGGHLVQGHVDGTGTIEQIARDKDGHTIWIRCEPQVLAFMIAKGSVAIDGVSLTIVDVERKRFSVKLIPTTLEATTIGELKAGDRVNLEGDLIGKWVSKRLEEMLGGKAAGKITWGKLAEQGFT